MSRICSTYGLALTADIDDAKRMLRADPDTLIRLAAEIRERNAREAEAAASLNVPAQLPSVPA